MALIQVYLAACSVAPDPMLAAGSPASPSMMQDLFVRVGGPDGSIAEPVAADVMVSVQSGHVIGDNMWYRRDHTPTE